MSVQVRVKNGQKGFYGGLIREPGDKFYLLAGDELSSRWMERVYQDEPKPKKKGKKKGGI